MARSALQSGPCRLAAVMMLALAGGAACSRDSCEDGPFGGATCTIGGEISQGDTLLFQGESILVSALALYGVGWGEPTSIRWWSTDTTVLAVDALRSLDADVEAKAPGAAWVVAYINETILDSIRASVVIRGSARWDRSFPGVPIGLYPAIGADTRVRVVTGGPTPSLWILAPDSGTGTSAGSCFSLLGPSLGASNEAFTSGLSCTRRHAADGGSTWMLPVGNEALGVAVAVDGGVVTVSQDSVFRLSATGTVLWELPVGGTPRTAPVIGPGGDVYLGWSSGGADSVSRFGLEGSLRWQSAVPGLSPGSPAVAGARLVFGRPGGIFAIDSAGTVAWDRAFSAVNPAATGASRTSSPVHDGVALFVQNEEALYSYSVGGSFVWVADSLGLGASSGVVGAPVLLRDATLAVPCTDGSGGRTVCVVRQANGTLVWRAPSTGDAVEGIAVGEDGTLVVTRTVAGGGSSVAGLWARVPPDIVGWPTEGRTQAHGRR